MYKRKAVSLGKGLSDLLQHSSGIHHVIYMLLTIGWTPGIHPNAQFLENSACDVFEAVFCFSTGNKSNYINWNWLPLLFFCNTNVLKSTDIGNLKTVPRDGCLLLEQPSPMLYVMRPSSLLPSLQGIFSSSNSCFTYVTRNNSLIKNFQHPFQANTNRNLINWDNSTRFLKRSWTNTLMKL